MGRSLNPVEERHAKILEELDRNPFILDDELASAMNVSIHTIRSDRRKIGIPEVRRRGRDVSDTMFAQARTLREPEITGDILELDLDSEGLSLMDTDESMALQKTS